MNIILKIFCVGLLALELYKLSSNHSQSTIGYFLVK